MELISRVNALLRMAIRTDVPSGTLSEVRRVKSEDSAHTTGSFADVRTALTCGPITLEPARHQVMVDGSEVMLTVKEFALLYTFMEYPGLVFTRGQLLKQVWGFDYVDGTRTVDVHIQTLRQKLGAAGVCIQTVRGIGYRLGA